MAPSVAVCVPAMAALRSLQSAFGPNNLRSARNGSPSVSSPSPSLCVASSGRSSREGHKEKETERKSEVNRREALGLCGLAAAYPLLRSDGDRMSATAGGLPAEDKPRLCDAECEKELENIPTITTPSGLQYKDVVVGKGPTPPVGFQVAANYVAMVPSGKIFDSSLEKGSPYIFRVGSEQVIKGLDEGVLSMKVGGRRRLYIPGELAFPNGLKASAGRPSVPASSPVVFDVDLLYVPGLEDEEE